MKEPPLHLEKMTLHRSSSENILGSHSHSPPTSSEPILHSMSTTSLRGSMLRPPPIQLEPVAKAIVQPGSVPLPLSSTSSPPSSQPLPLPSSSTLITTMATKLAPRSPYVPLEFPSTLPFPIHSLAAKGELKELKVSVQKNQAFFARLETDEAGSMSATVTSSHSSKASSIGQETREEEGQATSGFSIDIRNCHGMTALHGACYFGKVDTVDYLIALGADVNSFSHFGASVLSLSSCPSNVSLMAPSTSRRDSVYTKPQRARLWATPLHFAASNGHKAVVHSLLAHGADERLLDYKDNTPAQVARLQNHKKTAAILEQAALDRYKTSQEALVVGSGGTNAALHAYGNAHAAPPVTLADLKRSETLGKLKKEGTRSMPRLFHRKSEKAATTIESNVGHARKSKSKPHVAYEPLTASHSSEALAKDQLT